MKRLYFPNRGFYEIRGAFVTFQLKIKSVTLDSNNSAEHSRMFIHTGINKLEDIFTILDTKLWN